MKIPTECQKLASAASRLFAAIGVEMTTDYYGDNEEGVVYFLGSQWSRLMMRGDIVGGKLEKFEFTIHDGETPQSVFWVKPNCPGETMDGLFANLWQELRFPPNEALTALVGVQRELAKLL
jgi:hypothetical protein